MILVTLPSSLLDSFLTEISRETPKITVKPVNVKHLLAAGFDFDFKAVATPKV